MANHVPRAGGVQAAEGAAQRAKRLDAAEHGATLYGPPAGDSTPTAIAAEPSDIRGRSQDHHTRVAMPFNSVIGPSIRAS
jgi:hypothetical protein